MIRYRLDDLGWYQFEWLVQSLLKGYLGLGVESWGGSGDHGVDAYFKGSLQFPQKGIDQDGPFIFQAKFIEGANAAGAKSNRPLLKAVDRECGRIKERVELLKWPALRNYVLLTNAPLSPELRQDIAARLHNEVPNASVHSLGGSDVCDILDDQPNLVRAFPQLLSLRDLESLLREVVSKEVLQRSHYAIECAREVLPVFVPTSAYIKTWDILRTHHFAVLEGPPEVGKSAVAWTVAISQLSRGWQAIDCSEPEDFFKSFDPDVPQVFVADDAFGRVDYDPARLRKWEMNIDRMHRALNPHHWLIWTSRRHILERARKAMDLQGKTSDFPHPGELVIDATQLSQREKALMLYRHVRATNLTGKIRQFLKEFAIIVVGDPNLTPERIRRFVLLQLPEIVARLADETKIVPPKSPQQDQRLITSGVRNTLRRRKFAEEAIRSAIRDSTKRMRKAFASLPLSHKWMLIAMLDAGDLVVAETVEQFYQQNCPERNQEPFLEVLEDLVGSFIRAQIAVGGRNEKPWRLDWIHPSFKDLVIEELSRYPRIRDTFLKVMSMPGLRIAISTSGGPEGRRVFPFLISKQNWEVFRKRCISIAANASQDEIASLLLVLTDAHSNAPNDKTRLQAERIIEETCSKVRTRWDSQGTAISSDALSAYCEAGRRLVEMPDLPTIGLSWREKESRVRKELHEIESIYSLDLGHVYDWARFARIVMDFEPWRIQGDRFSITFAHEVAELIQLAEAEIRDTREEDSTDALSSWGEDASGVRFDAAQVATLGDVLGQLALILQGDREKLENLASGIKRKSSRLEDRAHALEAGPDEFLEDSYPRSERDFSVWRLFSDL